MRSPSKVLVDHFLSRVDAGVRPALAASPDLEQRLAAMIDDAEGAWPDLCVPAERFVTYVAERAAPRRDARGAGDALDGVRGADLYLACACAAGDPAALAAFDARYFGEVNAALARMRVQAASVDEVKQLVRQKLFVPRGDEPGKITEYSGRGDLRRWVRSIAIRTCLNLMRQGRREVLAGDDRVMAGMAAAGDDPELAYMKAKYRGEFRESFGEALASLTERQQTLLRYSYIDGLNIDEIGAVYRVHRVTAYRWLDKAREALVKRTLERMKARLKVDRGEFDSILRMIRSQIYVSLRRYLGADGGGADGATEEP